MCGGANGASLDTEEPIFFFFSVLVAGARFSVHPGGGLVRCQQGQCSYLPAEKVQHIPRTHNFGFNATSFDWGEKKMQLAASNGNAAGLLDVTEKCLEKLLVGATRSRCGTAH